MFNLFRYIEKAENADRVMMWAAYGGVAVMSAYIIFTWVTMYLDHVK